MNSECKGTVSEDGPVFTKLKEVLLDKEAQSKEEHFRIDKFNMITTFMDIVPQKKLKT